MKGVIMKTVRQLALGIILMLISSQANATSFTVEALANSTNGGYGGGTGLDTNIYYSAGDFLSVSVDPNDLWSAGNLPRWSDADGLIGDLYATGSDESGQPIGTKIGTNKGLYTYQGVSLPYGTLVGEIDGNYFKLGTSFAGEAPASGYLKLYYWDSDRDNNRGAVTANINAVPEPSTLLLLGGGMVGLVSFRLRRKTKR